MVDASRAEVRSEHSGDFLRLTQLWANRTHFSLIFAAYDNPHYRNELIERLDAVRPGLRIELSATDTPEYWLTQLVAATHEGAQRVHTLLPQNQAEPAQWWQRANVLRERLADAFPEPVLLWLTDADIDTAAHQAPDLWNWREAVFPFTHTGSLPLPALSSERFSPSNDSSSQQVKQRLADILLYLQQNAADPQTTAYLQLEAAQAHERLGQWTESEAAARAAANAFQLAGNAQLAAQAKSQVANILRARGQPGEALRILSDEVQPTFERLGDMRSKAITVGRIADILQARGQLDEALRIRQEEELPVYERIGDVREKAVTMGNIADILQDRGQLDEALRIRQEEELPVYELLGDVHSKAVTMSQIADILQARGQLEEALRILQKEVQPAFERLGDVRSKAVTIGKIANIMQSRGQLDEALRLHEERASTFKALGDKDGFAHVLYSVANLMLERGDHEKGGIQTIYEKLAEAFAISRDLGRADFIAGSGVLLAQVLTLKGLIDEALDVLTHAASAYATLGNESGLKEVARLREEIEAQRPSA